MDDILAYRLDVALPSRFRHEGRQTRISMEVCALVALRRVAHMHGFLLTQAWVRAAAPDPRETAVGHFFWSSVTSGGIGPGAPGGIDPGLPGGMDPGAPGGIDPGTSAGLLPDAVAEGTRARSGEKVSLPGRGEVLLAGGSARRGPFDAR